MISRSQIRLFQADLLKKNQFKLDFGLDFYTDVLDLEYLLQLLDDGPFTKRFKKLNKALVELIEDYSLVSFIPLDVYSDKSLLNLKSAIDKVSGLLQNVDVYFIFCYFRLMAMFMGVEKNAASKHCCLARWEQEQRQKDLIQTSFDVLFFNETK